VSGAPAERTIAIGELAARTGVEEGTLRMWERRHGFPSPQRLGSGHRRYREADVERVLRVLRERAAGLSLAAAIARVAQPDGAGQSVFAGLRARRPDLQPVVLRKRVLLALSRAIEDESCARAERPLLFGAFQRERFYRQSQRRWRELARTAELAVVFADFDRARTPANGPAELPLDRSGPLAREWAVVCDAPGHAACLAGIELPAARRPRDGAREFEVIWSVEPAVVRAAVGVCMGLVRAAAPELAGRVGEPPRALADEGQLRLAAAIAARTLARVG
jgi:DICT domain-containing protein/predicted DNA-binding transcriptional regulator AlpA